MTSGSASGFDIDHTSFAVHDALGWARRLRRELGAVPIAGEVLAEFRYLLLYVGTADEGGRLELLEPAGPGFLTRFLSAHGEAPHHLTFTVPALDEAVRSVRSLGMTVVGENYGHPAWREAFITPDAVHGTVIQLVAKLRGSDGSDVVDVAVEHAGCGLGPARTDPPRVDRQSRIAPPVRGGSRSTGASVEGPRKVSKSAPPV